MIPSLRFSSLILISALKVVPSAGTSFCGFPIDILLIPDPFAEPLEICNGLVSDEASCEASQFFSGYECYWEDGQCTSGAHQTGEDATCPSILDQVTCEDTQWFGARACVWWAPTPSPSLSPSFLPSATPSGVPSMIPSQEPTNAPTATPSRTPSVEPSATPSVQPSSSPSDAPSGSPTQEPSVVPSEGPTSEPSFYPSGEPSSAPTDEPTDTPSDAPSGEPSSSPSFVPSITPTKTPSQGPSSLPSVSPSENPTLTPTLAPSGQPSALPSLLPSATPTSVPSEDPTGSPTLTPSHVPSLTPSQTPTGEPTQIPSVTPTFLPSAPPSKKTLKTAPPTTSRMPSTIPTVSPSMLPSTLRTDPETHPPVLINPQKFSWNIDRLGDPRVAFNDQSDEEEIMIDYNVSLRENTVVIYEEDCKTLVPTSVIGVNKELTPVTSSHGVLAVDLDIKQAAIVGSAVWSDGEVGIGYIDICIRVDLWLVEGSNPPESVNFHETKLYLTIDLTQNFNITMELNRTEADNTAQNATVDYTLIACQCDTTLTCTNDVLTPGSDVFFCVETTSTDVHFVSILSIEMTQNALKWHPVKDAVEDDLTAVSLQGDKCIVRTQMASVFFEEDNPPDVFVEGVALLEFKDTGTGNRVRVRYLQSNTLNRHAQENEGDVSAFSVDLALSSEINSGASGPLKGMVSMLAITASGVWYLL